MIRTRAPRHGPRYADVCRDGCHIHLKSAPPAPRDVCLVARDVQALCADFGSAQVPFVVKLRDMPYGREFYIRDPDGYVLGFVEPASS